MRSHFAKMHTLIPPGTSGNATIDHFRIGKSEHDWSRIRAAVTGGREGVIQMGIYARLTVNGATMMSDTQQEHETNEDALFCATGDVLIVGLGLGMLFEAIVRKPDVTSVTVLEINPNVIKLVWQYVCHPKATLVKADVFAWKPPKGVRWDYIWLDIWENSSDDTKKEAAALKRKLRPYLRRGGRIHYWSIT